METIRGIVSFNMRFFHRPLGCCKEYVLRKKKIKKSQRKLEWGEKKVNSSTQMMKRTKQYY